MSTTILNQSFKGRCKACVPCVPTYSGHNVYDIPYNARLAAQGKANTSIWRYASTNYCHNYNPDGGYVYTIKLNADSNYREQNYSILDGSFTIESDWERFSSNGELSYDVTYFMYWTSNMGKCSVTLTNKDTGAVIANLTRSGIGTMNYSTYHHRTTLLDSNTGNFSNIRAYHNADGTLKIHVKCVWSSYAVNGSANGRFDDINTTWNRQYSSNEDISYGTYYLPLEASAEYDVELTPYELPHTVTVKNNSANPASASGFKINNVSRTSYSAYKNSTVQVGADTIPKGYKFSKWVINEMSLSLFENPTSFPMPYNNVTAEIYLEANNYTISWDPCNGTGATTTIQTFGTKITNIPTPTWADHTFNGWWTSPTGGTQITSDTTFNNAGDIKYYAHWIANTTKVYVVKDPSDSDVEFSFHQPGEYDWTIGSNFTIEVEDGTGYILKNITYGTTTTTDHIISVKITGPTTITAHTALRTYNITYHNSDGSVFGTIDTKTYGVKYTIRDSHPAAPTTTSKFLGWNTKADGTGITYVIGQTVITEQALDLYPVFGNWSKISGIWVKHNNSWHC